MLQKICPPSSFSVISTKSCAAELFGFLESLAIHHPNAKVYVMCDTPTMEIDKTNDYALNITWIPSLDYYSDLNRDSMIEEGVFGEFLSNKARVMIRALDDGNLDTLMLGCDIILTSPITDVDASKDLGVSPAFLRGDIEANFGKYNGDMVWTRSKEVCLDWIELIKTSTFYDQKAIEPLVEKYKTSFFTFGENYNVQTWRFQLAVGGEDEIVSKTYINEDGGEVFYAGKPLKFLHAHFSTPNDGHQSFKSFFIEKLRAAGGRYDSELRIIDRLLTLKE